MLLDQDLPQTVPPEQQEIENLKRERDDLYDRLLRKQAEFDNFKKRIEREKSEYMQFASAELMKELLNALDSFDLAIRNASKDGKGGESTLRGFELIYKQLQDTLARFGLKAIGSEREERSIPISIKLLPRSPLDDVEENTVIEEMRKGYTLNGRLLRPAMVSVSTKNRRPHADAFCVSLYPVPRKIKIERQTGLLRSPWRFAERQRSGDQERLPQARTATSPRSKSGKSTS